MVAAVDRNGENTHCSSHDNIVVTMNIGQLEQKTLTYSHEYWFKNKALSVHYSQCERTGVLVQFIHEVHSYVLEV